MHRYTCATAPHESVSSHPHQKHRDKVVDTGLHNHQPTSHQRHPPTQPTALTTPQFYSHQFMVLRPRRALGSPSSQRPLLPPGCVPVLAYTGLSPACSDSLRRCPAVALAPAFLAWCSSSVPCHPARHGAASQRLRNEVRVAQWDPAPSKSFPPLPTSACAAWVAEQNESPHQVLHGHGDALWGNTLAHGSHTCQVLRGPEVPYTE